MHNAWENCANITFYLLFMELQIEITPCDIIWQYYLYCGVGSENFVFICSPFKLKINMQISKALKCQSQR